MSETQDAIIGELQAAGLMWTSEQLFEAAGRMGQVLVELRATHLAAAASVGLLMEHIVGQVQPMETRLDFLAQWIEALQRAVRDGLDA
jgi:hypothetical protein